MPREWKTKSFKSGNSVAVRLPKALGFNEGEDVVIVPHADGSFSVWKESDAKSIFLNLYGSMSPDFMKDGRGDIDQDDRSWDMSATEEAA